MSVRSTIVAACSWPVLSAAEMRASENAPCGRGAMSAMLGVGVSSPLGCATITASARASGRGSGSSAASRAGPSSLNGSPGVSTTGMAAPGEAAGAGFSGPPPSEGGTACDPSGSAWTAGPSPSGAAGSAAVAGSTVVVRSAAAGGGTGVSVACCAAAFSSSEATRSGWAHAQRSQAASHARRAVRTGSTAATRSIATSPGAFTGLMTARAARQSLPLPGL
jgi:hypothetical protein